MITYLIYKKLIYNVESTPKSVFSR